jgi:hypothetical protein
MAAESDVLTAGIYTVGGTGLASLVFFALRHVILKISKDATTVMSDASYRAQMSDMREEIKRLEDIIKEQGKSSAQTNNQIFKLRMAFVDEQAALLRILSEMNKSDDPTISARISAEIQAANHRRLAVLDAMNEGAKDGQ